jgi:hypothetical protein
MDFLTVVCSEKTREALQNWNLHDDEAERFCVIDGRCLHVLSNPSEARVGLTHRLSLTVEDLLMLMLLLLSSLLCQTWSPRTHSMWICC